MDTLTAIATRRSVGKFTDQAVAPALLEGVLQAACWAPNHHRTEPWRLTVFTGEGRRQLQAAMVAAAQAMPDGPDATLRLSKAQSVPLSAPVVVAVHCAVGQGQGKTPPVWEEHAAVAAACQNLLLAAHAQGLAAIWRSGPYADYPQLEALLGVDKARGDRIMGFIYLGYPDPTADPLRNTPLWQKVTRLVAE